MATSIHDALCGMIEEWEGDTDRARQFPAWIESDYTDPSTGDVDAFLLKWEAIIKELSAPGALHSA